MAQGAWEAGRCANCDATLDHDGRPDRLFCGPRCRSHASDVRYFRRCRRERRDADPLVRQALAVRLAHVVGGGYDSEARRVPPRLRAEVLASNNGLCVACNQRVAEEVDHIDGSSSARENLQGLCASCHHAKTAARMRPMGRDQLAARDRFILRVESEPPQRACDDDLYWDEDQPRLREKAQAWFWSDAEEIELTPAMRTALGLPAAEGSEFGDSH
ncbi:MAG: endonuclease [Streptosporangiaceae bacterium]|nr:endonuclease [Streptosporangiaceae bacterium]